jgi:ubiquitin-like 1-activating enzyme E1 A
MMSADLVGLDGIKDVKRHDRSIRLWGAATQRGLQGAQVLVLGANGLSNEVCKNLVLSGIGRLVIQDAGVLSAEDLKKSALFSVPPERAGASRAQLLAEHLKEMNPSVNVEGKQANVTSFDAAFLRTFHFIIATSRGVESIREADVCTAVLEGRGGADETTGEPPDEPQAKRHCANGDSGPPVARSNGAHVVVPLRKLCEPGASPMPRILAAATIGLEGFCFFDLGEARCMLSPKKAAAEAQAPPADEMPVGVWERAYYPTIKSACSVEWPSLTTRVPRLYYAVQLLRHAASSLAAGSRSPVPSPVPSSLADATSLLPAGSSDATVERLQTMLTRRAELLHGEGKGEAAKLLTPSYLAEVAQNVGFELAPVCAVVGGMVASEVIKIISNKERPVNNTFFFDGTSADGIILRLGPSFDTSSGVDKGEFKELKSWEQP